MNLSVTLSLAFFSIFLDCSVEYISLKKLCHYGDSNVPEAIQKKAYGILAPLFSEYYKEEDAIVPQKNFNGRSLDTRIQALQYFILVLANNYNLEKKLAYDIMDYISARIQNNSFNYIREYSSHYHNKSGSIPCLYKDGILLLHNEHGILEFKNEKINNLNAFEAFNYRTNPIAILKISATEELKQIQSNSDELVLCLFESGCMALVNLKLKKTIWQRQYSTHDEFGNQLLFPDKLFKLIGGYKNSICFAKENVLNFYTFDQIFSHKTLPNNTISNEKFRMIHNEDYIVSSTFNYNFLFYTFCFYQPDGEVYHSSPPKSHFKVGGNDLNRHLYYSSYTDKKNEEKILLSLECGNNFFVWIACNDTCLIVRDNSETLYVFDITKEPFKLKFTIHDSEECLNRFWLDCGSEKILTDGWVLKIQDVFANLPNVNHGQNSLKLSTVKYNFYTGTLMRIYWFVRSWYWFLNSFGLFIQKSFILFMKKTFLNKSWFKNIALFSFSCLKEFFKI